MRIEESRIVSPGGVPSTTISIGSSQFTVNEPLKLNHLIHFLGMAIEVVESKLDTHLLEHHGAPIYAKSKDDQRKSGEAEEEKGDGDESEEVE